jgi:hypothetical protein
MENPQNAFSITQQSAEETLIIYIPQLELARAIFLINSYLCRACLTTTTLQQEFDVQHDVKNNHVDIHVLKTTNFPLSAFDQGGTKQILAWLLTNHLAMTSFESIHQHYYKNNESRRGWETWNFSFEPPPITNWCLSVRGRYAEDETKYLVEEIIGVEIDDEMPGSVAFINPNFIKKEQNDDSSGCSTGGGRSQNSGGDYEIDDTQTASDQNKTVVVNGDLSWVKFKKPSKVTIQNQIKPVSKVFVNKKGEDEGLKQGSTDEAYPGGGLPSVDVGGKQEVTDPEPKYASRFESFNHMLGVLIAKHGGKILSEETHRLPKVGRSQQHLLKCGSARAIKAVRLKLEGKEFVLMEVDTSDGAKMLSTKILFGAELTEWTEQFEKIRTGVVSAPTPLSWPNEKLTSFYGEDGHIGVHHPSQGEGAIAGSIPLESLTSWANRFVSNFLQLSESS